MIHDQSRIQNNFLYPTARRCDHTHRFYIRNASRDNTEQSRIILCVYKTIEFKWFIFTTALYNCDQMFGELIKNRLRVTDVRS